MKAAAYTRYGPPDVVQIMDVEKPVPQDNEVLIKVRAASVGDQLFVEINSWALHCGTNQDQVPNCPVRIFLKPFSLNTRMVREFHGGKFSISTWKMQNAWGWC